MLKLIKARFNGQKYIIRGKNELPRQITIGIKLWGIHKGETCAFLDGRYNKEELKIIIKAIQEREKEDLIG